MKPTMKKITAVIFLSITTVGCETLAPPSAVEVVTSAPEEGVISVAKMGDVIAERSSKSVMTSVETLVDFQHYVFGGVVKGNYVKAGACIPVAGGRFLPREQYNSWGKPIPREMEMFSFSIIDEELCYLDGDNCLAKAEWRYYQFVDYSAPYKEQKLFYRGVQNGQMLIEYRRLDNVKAADTQLLTFDVTRNPFIDFKGLEIEIISATDKEITYEIISGFDSSE